MIDLIRLNEEDIKKAAEKVMAAPIITRQDDIEVYSDMLYALHIGNIEAYSNMLYALHAEKS